MAKWFENNMSAVREYPFDFERYMEQRLREIDNLDERRFMKEILLQGLGSAVQFMEEKYRKLERRVYDEYEPRANQYETVMTIVKREHYDPANKTLYPVADMDLDPGKLAEALSEEGRIFRGKIFFEGDDGRQRAFEETGRFAGVSGGEAALFCVKPASRYRDRIELLYRIFQANHAPWQTVHTGYLDKFYDVFQAAGNTGNIPSEEGVRLPLGEARLYCGEYTAFVRPDMLALRDMAWIAFDSANFMVPRTDGICYEHEFSLDDREEGDGYLIRPNEDILEIRHEGKKMILKSKIELFEGWEALHIIQRPTVRSPDYDAPFLTNRRRDSFLCRYAEKSGTPLMTKTDLFRRIMELDVREFIEVTGYELSRETGGPAAPGMNWFVQDGLFPMEGRATLVFKFKEKMPGHYLNGSMARFVISQMQMEISEYRCVGVLV